MKDVKQALADLANDGVIEPRRVVDAARDPDSPLHDCFTWDDTVAGERYRLDQARRLIRVYVVKLLPGDVPPVRAFVSLTTDRKAGGGYRALVDVLNDEALYAQMLEDALDEMNSFKVKYGRIKELQTVFAEVEKAEKRHRRKAAPVQAAA